MHVAEDIENPEILKLMSGPENRENPEMLILMSGQDACC